ncbi:alpha-galactosidase [Rathayibacter sp. PhB127]|uniref:glycoside hydrolase family 36 protein n=1 Tax=Rathayibacter sp. PhB127 TaxID=2485176 RepID=UPI000F4B2B0E|nr:glycoside hydrolase family 36 protein [Rathayibacter sp. PhB127]ROS21570.1 alpha-galactosidase [Rathayibacter sp. PhB127]
MPERGLLRWGPLVLALGDDAPVALIGIGDGSLLEPGTEQPLVELSAFGHGRFPGGFRHVDTVIGARLRPVSTEADDARLRILQADPETGIRVTSVFERAKGIDAVRTWTEVDGDDLVLDFVSTFATGAFAADAAVDELSLASAQNDWVAEGRWSVRPLREIGLARIDRELQHHPPRSRHVTQNRGSWSSGEQAPTAALLGGPQALAWQVEHNGPWLFELGETRRGAYLLLSGPTDQEHQWSHRLVAGEPFVSVPASIAFAAGGVDAVLGALTDQRRAIREDRAADRALPVVFNDYMNTLMGDPTTEKLLPLIDAAAEAGADTFCIDAGWYAEGTWWDTVGEWQPAASRFPGGLGEVIGRIREQGMTAGLWLEPEVIGVRSPLAVRGSATALPDEAFFSRDGVRVAEHGRHLLDLRSAAARAHLDEVVDRIVTEYGVDFLKMDCNTMPGPGTDSDGTAPGAGLLAHARALLDWIDAVQARHPSLLIESCASGAMRMDYAMLSRLHLQSTSDQQDPVMYASIAAAAPASILPEQAGNWAYPLSGTDRELMIFALANGVLGRMYLSGYLNRMTEGERELVREAVAAQKSVLGSIERSHPFWPLGLPGWDDEWLALGLATDEDAHLTVWRRPGAAATIALPLPSWRGRSLSVEPFFPADPAGWSWTWDQEAAVLVIEAPVAPSARVLRLR